MLKHEAILRLGYEDKPLALEDSRSVSSKSNSSTFMLSDSIKPKAIEYLSKGRE